MSILLSLSSAMSSLPKCQLFGVDQKYLYNYIPIYEKSNSLYFYIYHSFYHNSFLYKFVLYFCNDRFLFSDKMYIAFLHSCYFNVEHAKKTIKKYYSYHFDVPQVFCELDPLSDDIKQHIRCM